MSPYCNVRRFMEALGRVPDRPGWYWAIGSVSFHGDRGRYVFHPLVGPGLDILKGGKYGRVLLSIGGMVVDSSVAKIEKGRIYLVLPREHNDTWSRLYGTCQIGYVIPKRLFLLLTDQVLNDFALTYIFRKRTDLRIRA
jgi:hypothetical protein